MAELTQIPARAQLWAVAWLRWRMFVNGFRWRKSEGSGAGGLVLAVVLRLLLWPIFAFWVIGPVGAAGYFSYIATVSHRLPWMMALLTGIAVLWQFIAITGSNIAAAMPTFHPSSLLRFPMPFGRYLLLRTALGLLTPSTIAGSLAVLAAAAGVCVANPALAWRAVPVFALYALMNMFCARMVAIWLERIMAIRRVREIFGAALAVFFVGFQLMQFSRMGRHGQALYARIASSSDQWAGVARWLPPGYVTDAVLGHARMAALSGEVFLLCGWTALFLAGFAYRLHRQFLGESLSEGAPQSSARVIALARTSPKRAAPKVVSSASSSPRLLSPAILAVVRKEWMTLRSNSTQWIGMVTPLFFVFVLSRGIPVRHGTYLLPGAIAYALLGPMAAAYNIFGPDGPGVQMYLLAPVPLRQIVVGKNIATIGVLSVQASVAWWIAARRSAAPIPLAMEATALMWLLFVLASNLAIGTVRSIQSPRRLISGHPRMSRTAPASRTSALLVIAVVLASLGLEIAITNVSARMNAPWLAGAVFAALGVGALIAYGWMLTRVEGLILRHRDVLEHELCGSSD